MEMIRKFLFFILITTIILGYGCSPKLEVAPGNMPTDWKSKEIPPSKQSGPGDPERGFNYMKSGEYIGSGVPWDMMKKRVDKRRDSLTDFEVEPGYYLNYKISLFKTPNGQKVVSGNCFTCHGTTFNGQLHYGLGDTFYDFTKSQKAPAHILNTLVKLKYNKKKPEREAFEDFGNYYKALAPKIVTPVLGVNPAFRLAEACVQHRNPVDLTYEKAERFEMMKFTIATDVPPLWHVKKKNALYYNAMGRGDFTKLLMQSVLLGLPDSTMARKVQQEFVHVLAWLESLEAPSYPKSLNEPLVARGKTLFEKHCRNCHGSYGENESYPNKVIALSVIKTDPWYAWYTKDHAGFSSWYNKSWFAVSTPVSKNVPLDGYIAPPLDGIWASAPYLHNGSVPTLNALLNSRERPEIWQRTGETDDYDFVNVGWNYKTKKNASGKFVYDTTVPGYGKQGHTFGDKFNEEERKALIEYLKTL